MAGTIRPPPIEATGGQDLTGITAIRDTIGHHHEYTVIRGQIIFTGTSTDIRGLIILTGTGETGGNRACYLLNGTNELSSQ